MSSKENLLGVISKNEMYTFFRFKKTLGLTESAFRSLKKKGLPVIRSGKRGFVVGEDAIEFFRGMTTDDGKGSQTI